jgi:hypothetical protein
MKKIAFFTLLLSVGFVLLSSHLSQSGSLTLLGTGKQGAGGGGGGGGSPCASVCLVIGIL